MLFRAEDAGVFATAPALSPATAVDEFRRDCIAGLSATSKALPCKWLYDTVGSALFERITRLAEYYPARIETALLGQAAPRLAAIISPDTALVEFGSGASVKTRLLLDAMPAVTAYVPIDISVDALDAAAAAIVRDYPSLTVTALCSDFSELAGRRLPVDTPVLGFFPGSTLGNFTAAAASRLLVAFRDFLGPGAQLLIGNDLPKPVDRLVAAYDDAAGVTAAFNLNLIDRLNRELHADVSPDAFMHRAVWNEALDRIEMHLVARRPVAFRIGDRRFVMAAGETIHTESSHKWPAAMLDSLFLEAGWRATQHWSAAAPAFRLSLLQA